MLIKIFPPITPAKVKKKILGSRLINVENLQRFVAYEGLLERMKREEYFTCPFPL